MPKLQLPFKHRVIETRQHVSYGYVVLVEIMDKGYTKYSTYRADKNGACVWGHYTDSFDEASEDFRIR